MRPTWSRALRIHRAVGRELILFRFIFMNRRILRDDLFRFGFFCGNENFLILFSIFISVIAFVSLVGFFHFFTYLRLVVRIIRDVNFRTYSRYLIKLGCHIFRNADATMEAG